MKKILIFAFTLMILAGIIFMVYKIWTKKNGDNQIKGSKIEYSQIQIKGKKIKAEVADNLEERMKGLSGREGMGENEGMLFVFEKPDIYPFWMKDMKFAIDIIWLKNKKIVELVQDAQPPTVVGQVQNYMPKAAADLVLELPAGFCAENNVKIGDEIIIK